MISEPSLGGSVSFILKAEIHNAGSLSLSVSEDGKSVPL